MSELDLPSFDERAVRRATRRGVIRTALVAAVALVVVAGLFGAATMAIGALKTERFYRVAYHGTLVAHPEYHMRQDGSCCAAGPLLGLTNLGLKSELRLRATPIGALSFPGDTIVRVTQGITGGLHTDLDSGSVNPLGQALARGRPDPARSESFLRSVPDTTLVSALVEFGSPLDQQAFAGFFDGRVPVRAVPDRGVPIFAVNPYADNRYQPVSWPHASIEELRAWAESLESGDDGLLDDLGLPPSAEIKRIAQEGRVYAFVLPRIPLPDLRRLASDPAVRSVNVLDAGIDTGWQYPR